MLVCSSVSHGVPLAATRSLRGNGKAREIPTEIVPSCEISSETSSEAMPHRESLSEEAPQCSLTRADPQADENASAAEMADLDEAIRRSMLPANVPDSLGARFPQKERRSSFVSTNL